MGAIEQQRRREHIAAVARRNGRLGGRPTILARLTRAQEERLRRLWVCPRIERRHRDEVARVASTMLAGQPVTWEMLRNRYGPRGG